MALTRSTGLRKKMMDTGSFKSIFALAFINFYSGPRPASADDAVPAGATLLAVISQAGSGTGLSWDTAAAAGVLLKKQDEVWSEDAILAPGVPAWFRLHEAGDTPANASTTYARLDGSVGVSGADLNINSVNFTVGAPLVLNNTTKFTLP